jgi:hypothetical protein
MEKDMKMSKNGFGKLVPIMCFLLSAMVPLPGHASTLIGTFNTGNQFDDGGCFVQWFSRAIGPGLRAANVQLAGHDMQYRRTDLHIKRSKMAIDYVRYNRVAGNVSFRVSGCFHDNSGDDHIIWRAYYAIVGDEF